MTLLGFRRDVSSWLDPVASSAPGCRAGQCRVIHSRLNYRFFVALEARVLRSFFIPDFLYFLAVF